MTRESDDFTKVIMLNKVKLNERNTMKELKKKNFEKSQSLNYRANENIHHNLTILGQ